MNLFSTQSEQVKEQAKEALKNVIKMNVAKYLSVQNSLVDLLTSGKDLTSSKADGKKHKKKCNLCRINSMMAAISSYKDISAEAATQYELLFGEELDMDAILNEISTKLKNKADSSGEFVLDKDGTLIMPADAPQEVKDMMSTIQEALNKKGLGGNMSMEVIDLKGQNFGLNPEDFSDFVSFARAVSQKRAEFAENNKGKSGEDIINEAVILNAEKTVDSTSEQTKEKLN